MRRAQEAIVREDWAAVRNYAEAALQSRPDDVLSKTYKRDAELRLDAAQKKLDATTPPTTTPPTTTTPTTTPTTPVTTTTPVTRPRP